MNIDDVCLIKYPLCIAAGEDGNEFRETELRDMVTLKCNKTVAPRLLPRQIEILKKLENNEKLTPEDILDCQLLQDLPGEEWRPIAVNPNYMVSNLGRVKSLARVEMDVANHVHPVKERILVCSLNRTGYVFADIQVPNHCKFVHRYVMDTFSPKTEEDIRLNKTDVNHLDGNKKNNNIENLEWSTRSENLLHAKRMNLNKSHGETHVFAKLTNAQVVEARQRAKRGEFIEDLAIEYGVSTGEMSGIINGTYYKEVDCIEAPYKADEHRGRGFNCPNSKFTKEQVIEIRRRRAAGEGSTALAKEFGVERHAISDMCTGKTYTDMDQVLRVRKYDPKPVVYNPNGNYKHTPDEFFKAEEMVNSGRSVRSVALELGVDHKTVRHWLIFAKQIRESQNKEKRDGNTNSEV